MSECKAVCAARDYYNSSDADNFYFCIWGGEDIHIGLYKDERENIFDASRRTVERMASHLTNLGQDARVLDMGAGFGGAARFLAKNYGCDVVALNLSECQNERDRDMNREQGLADKITVVDGNFEEVPEPDQSFDIIWSQDAILHSGNREKVIAEAARLLKPGGEMVFTDPMMTDDCPKEVLQPILDRIHLETLGSPGFYKQAAKGNGLQVVGFEEHAEMLGAHYQRVLEELQSREGEIGEVVSKDYIERMKKGLGHWVEGSKNGWLTWGILHFKKPA
jgi:sarcosine/dimethylglycine N-methyltransferase